MLIIYWKSDGEIYQVASNYKTMKEFYGRRTEEYSLIFDYIFIDDYDEYFFNRYIDFIIVDKKIKMKDNEGLFKILNL